MNFVADESIDKEVVDYLRQRNYSVKYVAETDPSLEDTFVLSLAQSQQAILLTADKDFGELIYRKRQLSNGVILLRLPRLTPHQKALLLEQVIDAHAETLSNAFCVINEERVRLRKL